MKKDARGEPRSLYSLRHTAIMFRLLHADGLDLLFELGGSTAMNKLEVMAYKPAALGASWLGYPHSAGLEQIDYILVDPYIRPEDPRLLIEQPFELAESWVCIDQLGFPEVPIDEALPTRVLLQWRPAVDPDGDWLRYRVSYRITARTGGVPLRANFFPVHNPDVGAGNSNSKRFRWSSYCS
jgi:hypothetical protein